MKRGKGLKRTTALKRTEMKRGEGLRNDPDMIRQWQRRSRKPLPPRSARRIEEKPERDALVEAMLAEFPWCQAEIPYFCTRKSREVNELKRGGQRATEYLIKEHTETLCHNCHRWITVHPNWAKGHGHQVDAEAGEEAFDIALAVRTLTVGKCDVDCTIDHRIEFE